MDSYKTLTVASAIDYWLQMRRDEVRSNTWHGYKQIAHYIVGPLLIGTKLQRHNLTRRGIKPPNAVFVDMLGPIEITALTTAQIRAWHKTVTAHVSAYTANVAKKFLRAALALTAEDHLVQIPPMPTRLGRGRTRQKKAILTPSQVGILLNAALQDQRGLYYAFPFLTGVRPSEQLALLWDDIDQNFSTIHIRRTQLPNGISSELTKTNSSVRDIPVSTLLRTMLSRWYAVCPRSKEGEQRVFPTLGRRGSTDPRNGRPLCHTNFIYTYWRPAFAELGLPLVTPHSARHAFISTLQSKGIEVGLVAKLAGHANAVVTLGHYTQAVRGGEDAIEALERAFRHHTEEPERPQF